jgi:geranylgeranyl diphosphate synthase type II
MEKYMSGDFKSYFEDKRKIIDDFLDRELPTSNEKPEILHKAMRYSIFAGGKRVRPFLALMVNDMFKGEGGDILYYASSVECIHTYSLIHDDLPALDNDDLRRGKPTNHVEFGEDIAIMAGDALLTFAFELMSFPPRNCGVKIINEVSKAAGARNGMVGGQVADLQGEKKKPTLNELEFIHKGKTMRLIEASCMIGAYYNEVSEQDLNRVRKYGQNLGLVFQIIDDILDITQDSQTLGKTAGKDLEAEKITYPSLMGIDNAKEKAKTLLDEAKSEISQIKNHGYLIDFADFMYNRQS